MPRATQPFYNLNAGEVSRLALMRVDLEKMRLAADTMVNWVPTALGPMTLRPGTGYVGETKNDASCRMLEFVYATDDAALLELTDQNLRIWANDALVTRDSVSSTIQAFGLWTVVASTAASVAVGTSPYGASDLVFKTVTQNALSYAYGTISILNADKARTHGLRIPVVQGGGLIFKIGSSQGADDIFPATKLGTGTHSIAFVPNANTVYVQLESQDYCSYAISPITIEAGGVMSLPTPWLGADIHSIRYDQSADVVYVACSGYPQRKIERRQNNSWSVVLYESLDGPFASAAGDNSVKLTPNVLSGDTTLDSNVSFFNSNYVGALVRLFHQGQTVIATLTASQSYTRPFRVSGAQNYSTGSVSTERQIYAIYSGTWSGYLVLQRTFDPDGKTDWVDMPNYAYSGGSGGTGGGYYNDNLNNVIVWYRWYLKTYNSGSVVVQISGTCGGGSGIARIQSIVSPTQARIRILSDFYGTTAANNWRISQWNGKEGYPSSVTLHEGRLWWSGGSRVWGSVSDNYESFDFDATGDAAPIQRSIGKGPIQNTNFMLSLGRLTIGTDAGIVTARSSSFDEPLTPTAFNLKYTNTQGTADLRGLSLDQKGVFVQRSGRRIYMITYTSQTFDYKTSDLTRLNPDIGVPGFTSISVQRQIDTRLHFVRGDGQLACLLYDEDDEILAWFRIKAADDGVIENVAVLPGTLEDQVYVVVRRTVNGATKRYLEKFARLDECVGDATTKLVDCHGTYSGVATTTITGLSYLEGKTVAVWGNGKDLGTYVVSGGQITGLSEAVTSAVVGLPYTAQFVSTKLAYAAREGTAVNQMKRVNKIGMVLDRTHYQGVRYGQYDKETGAYTADDLPLIEDGAATPAGTIWPYYDAQQFELNGAWNTDSRIYLEAASPRPATVLGFTIEMETSG